MSMALRRYFTSSRIIDIGTYPRLWNGTRCPLQILKSDLGNSTLYRCPSSIGPVGVGIAHIKRSLPCGMHTHKHQAHNTTAWIMRPWLLRRFQALLFYDDLSKFMVWVNLDEVSGLSSLLFRC